MLGRPPHNASVVVRTDAADLSASRWWLCRTLVPRNEEEWDTEDTSNDEPAAHDVEFPWLAMTPAVPNSNLDWHRLSTSALLFAARLPQSGTATSPPPVAASVVLMLPIAALRHLGPSATELPPLVKNSLRAWVAAGIHVRVGCRLVNPGGIRVDAEVCRTVPATDRPWAVVRCTSQTNVTIEYGPSPVPYSGRLIEESGPPVDARLARLLIEPLVAAFKDRVARRNLGIGPPRSILLYGPPGTGKTTAMEAVFAALPRALGRDAAVFICRGPRPSGEPRAARREIERAFVEADRYLSCINDDYDGIAVAAIVLDEIDGLRCQRTLARLIEMQREVATAIQSRRNCFLIVVATTNLPDSLEPSLARSFERRVEFALPGLEWKTEFLRDRVVREAVANGAAPLRTFVRDECGARSAADLVAIVRRAAEYADGGDSDGLLSLSSLVAAAKQLPPSIHRGRTIRVSPLSWDEVGGHDEAKRALRMAVEWPIHRTEALERFGLRHTFRGILLHGPPGSGKTSLVRAAASSVAGSAGLFALSGADVYSSGVGEAEAAVRRVFADARAARPSLVFFDEIDALVGSRAGSGARDDPVRSRVLSTLLNEMDGVEACDGVVVLSATNRLDLVDAALLRPGRFDRLVYVGAPPVDTVLRIELGRMGLAGDSLEQLVAAVTPRISADSSGADVVGLCRAAALTRFMRHDPGPVEMQDFVETLRQRTPLVSY